ncbi:hypothetical protein IVA79_22340 [Bradyrhizobium sp. 138]|uniref:hypothetical protein n=1 Tax=Bradyrhizobium sp. 138 TaxID=2782615 RepID=UPI001FFBF10D|nr:hypothetical protein [Bradyrhizobium sp. 138]MCK1736618.1 hypothetical protein [Bradyrhizobium sp. 138]
MAKLPIQEEIEAARALLEPYKLALGKVAHSWNHMQEQLGVLFCMVAGLDNRMGMAIWHALKSDRSQRELLQAAIEAASDDEEWTNDFPKAKEDISWILKKVNKLTDGRNSAIHAPVFSVVVGEPELRPNTILGNPNAAKLRGKDIIAEFEWYEEYFDSIKGFAAGVALALMGRRRPNSVWTQWPDRPRLPTVKQKSAREGLEVDPK